MEGEREKGEIYRRRVRDGKGVRKREGDREERDRYIVHECTCVYM